MTITSSSGRIKNNTFRHHNNNNNNNQHHHHRDTNFHTKKRRYQPQQRREERDGEYDEDGYVDDLMVAATYANHSMLLTTTTTNMTHPPLPYPTTKTTPPQPLLPSTDSSSVGSTDAANDHDSNEINIDDDENWVDRDDHDNDNNHDDDDDDNESNVDLREQLARMIQEEDYYDDDGVDGDNEENDDVDGKDDSNHENNEDGSAMRKQHRDKKTTNQRSDHNNHHNKIKDMMIPKTTNEIDGYHTNDMEQLESVLQWSLQVTTTTITASTKVPEAKHSHQGGVPYDNNNDDDHKPVSDSGTAIQDRMAHHNNTNDVLDVTSLSLQPAGYVLHYMIDDRTMIVQSNSTTSGHQSNQHHDNGMILDEGTVLFMKMQHRHEDDTTIVIIGKIFEIFGPIRSPLYSIRLPPLPTSSTTTSTRMHSRDDSSTIKNHHQQNSRKNHTKRNHNKKEQSVQQRSSEDDNNKDAVVPPSVMDNNLPGNAASILENTATSNCHEEEIKKSLCPPLHAVIDDDPPEHHNSIKDSMMPISAEEESMSNATPATNYEHHENMNMDEMKQKGSTVEEEEEVVQQNEAESAEGSSLPPLSSATAKEEMGSLNAEQIEQQSVPCHHEDQMDPNVVTTNDPWSKDGAYGRYILEKQKQKEMITIYYLPSDQPTQRSVRHPILSSSSAIFGRILDTASILRSNRKGCDASNMYDEEISNVYEMDFSDDEHERAAKNRHHSKKQPPLQEETMTMPAAAAVSGTSPTTTTSTNNIRLDDASMPPWSHGHRHRSPQQNNHSNVIGSSSNHNRHQNSTIRDYRGSSRHGTNHNDFRSKSSPHQNPLSPSHSTNITPPTSGMTSLNVSSARNHEGSAHMLEQQQTSTSMKNHAPIINTPNAAISMPSGMSFVPMYHQNPMTAFPPTSGQVPMNWAQSTQPQVHHLPYYPVIGQYQPYPHHPMYQQVATSLPLAASTRHPSYVSQPPIPSLPPKEEEEGDTVYYEY